LALVALVAAWRQSPPLRRAGRQRIRERVTCRTNPGSPGAALGFALLVPGWLQRHRQRRAGKAHPRTC